MKKYIKLGEVEIEHGYRAYYSRSEGNIRSRDGTGYAMLNVARILDHDQKMQDRTFDCFNGKTAIFITDITKSVNLE